VTSVLFRRGGAAHGRNLRQEVEDMVQEVYEFLLANDGRRMLAWDPDKGSAKTFFGLLAERCVLNILSSRRKSPWTEDPVEEQHLDRREDKSAGLEQTVGSREMLRALGERLLEALNDRDRRLFEALYIQQKDDEEVRELMGIGRDALYQARSRLLQRVRKLAADMGPEYEKLSGVG
jgi:RNA polymerase sigma-70 factor (ECF subfamily)